jgi:hyperosmotically inducible protein
MSILRHRLLSLAVLTGLFGVAATPQAFGQGDKSLQQRQMETEVQLQKEVRHVLVMLPFYSVFDNLEYKVEGDRVVLSGQVTDPSLKSNAEKAVRSIEGVASVDNQIEVLPLSPVDNRIRLAEYRAIYSAPNLQKYAQQAVPPIHIIVKAGHVTLEGVVLNQGDKTTAELRAKTVPGVFSVTNNLRTEK